MADSSISSSGDKTLSPGPGLTLAVAAESAGVSAVVALRAAGETKLVGFTKTARDTGFARADDRYFTPLVVLLALGATGSWISWLPTKPSVR